MTDKNNTTNQNSNEKIMEKVISLDMMFKRFHYCCSKHYGYTTTPHRGQGMVLMLLRKNPNILQKDLPKLLKMRQQSVAEFLQKLENNGLIERTPCKTDKRSMIVNLTEKGRQEAQIPPEIKRSTDELFNCLSEEEKKTMLICIDKLSKNLCEQVKALGEESMWEHSCCNHHCFPQKNPNSKK